MLKKVLLIIFLFLFGCSKIYMNVSDKIITSNKMILVSGIENNTEALYAGKKVENIVKSILISKKEILYNDSINGLNLNELLDIAKSKNIDIVLTGSVNEWRYQTGVDGRPAINITLYAYQVSTKKLIWSGTISKAGTVYETLGITAQNALNKLLGNL